MTRYLAFDIETSKIVPEEDDVQAHRPLGISCWALAWKRGDTIKTLAGHAKDDNDKVTSQMGVEQCKDLVSLLYTAWRVKGYTILAHNGVGFDFDILAEESGMHEECAELAMNSVDTCLLVHCMKGFPIGLEAICAGMGLPGKTEGMNGALAPQMWADGLYREVLAYVQQDVKATLQAALAIEEWGALTWISKSGRKNRLVLPRGLLPACEALKLPEPNTAWMDAPIPRDHFTGWMVQHIIVYVGRHLNQLLEYLLYYHQGRVVPS
jgi:hypothetical protein